MTTTLNTTTTWTSQELRDDIGNLVFTITWPSPNRYVLAPAGALRPLGGVSEFKSLEGAQYAALASMAEAFATALETAEQPKDLAK